MTTHHHPSRSPGAPATRPQPSLVVGLCLAVRRSWPATWCPGTATREVAR